MSNGRGQHGDYEALGELEQKLGYEFEDRSLLARAMTHRSYANEHREIDDDNQRLEFLGDAVLGVVIAEALFRDDDQAPEGALSSWLSQLVCERALVERALGLKLGEYLRLGRGEEMTGGRTKEALLADAYEALLGAVFLDGGHQRARRLILEQFEGMIDEVISSGDASVVRSSPRDYKSLLQRKVQQCRPIRPEYHIVETSGPPHERVFAAEVRVDSRVVGSGEGTSKKEAEQAAAAQAVTDLESSQGTLRRLLDEWSNSADESPTTAST